MELLAGIWRRLVLLLNRARSRRELDEELRFHLEMKTLENLAAGMRPREAKDEARQRFGSLLRVNEESTEAWGWGWLGRFGQDVKFALRTSRRHPAFAIVAIAVLSIGIGANTAIFSLINGLFLNPLPFPGADRLVFVQAYHTSGENSATGYRDFLDWREQNTVFEEMAIVPWTGMFTLTGAGDSERIPGAVTTAGFLRVLGIRPALGQFFSSEEDSPGGPKTLLLSHAAWQKRFGGVPDVVGRTLILDDVRFTVIGVLPANFVFPGVKSFDFVAALQGNPKSSRSQHQFGVIARLKPGIGVARAQTDMSVIAARLERQFPATNSGWKVRVQSTNQALMEEAGTPVLVLFLAVTFVLLIACANVAGLMLAKASGRAREMAVRASLGAGRTRLIRQMLTESFLLSVGSGLIALFVCGVLTRMMLGLAPEEAGLQGALRLDRPVLAFCVIVSILTAFLFGLAPAVFGSRAHLHSTLKGNSPLGSDAGSGNRFLSGVVVFEIAVSLVLLVGAGLLARDFALLLRQDTGVRPEGVVVFALNLQGDRYSTSARINEFYDDLLSEIRRVPAVRSVGAIDTLPMAGGYSGGGFEIEGKPKPVDWMKMSANLHHSRPGYFAVMGIPMLRGRDFRESDDSRAPRVALVNDVLVRRFFPNEDPIGHRIIWYGTYAEIVGVVKAVKHNGPAGGTEPEIYLPHKQGPSGGLHVVVKSSTGVSPLVGVVRDAVRRRDPKVPVPNPRPMEQVISESLSGTALIMQFIAGFAAFALVLTVVGIYGVVAYSVSQRTKELGIRFAMGASEASVVWLVLRRGAGLGAVGLCLGIPVALGVSVLLRSSLYGISAYDPAVFTIVPVVLLSAVILACYLPARRAARVNPIETLRAD